MSAIASLFDQATLLVCEGPPREGGIPLPQAARVVALRLPAGHGWRRKLDLVRRLPYYAGTISRQSREADVVHVPLPGDVPLLALVVAALSGKRLIGRYGGSWVATSETTLFNRVTRGFMRLLASRHVMLATGEAPRPPAPEMEWIFATALAQRELDAIHPVESRGLGTPPNLIYAGRLSEEKGVANLVRAVSELKRDRFVPLPRVTLAGGGPERKSLEGLADSLGCREEFEFAGQLAREPLSERLGASDFCVQPSLTEGFSKAWLDAMAHGLPVLSSDAGAARAVIGGDGERGWLVPPGDVGQLASALRRVLTSTLDWPALRRRCRAYVAERTLEVWANRIGLACVRRWGWQLVGGKLIG